jgi:hypothetical protein
MLTRKSKFLRVRNVMQEGSLELMGVESAKSVSGLVFTIRRDDTDERTVFVPWGSPIALRKPPILYLRWQMSSMPW